MLADSAVKVRRLAVNIETELVLDQDGHRQAGHRGLQRTDEDEELKGTEVPLGAEEA